MCHAKRSAPSGSASADVKAPKRLPAPPVSGYALFSCFDDADRLTEVPVAILAEFNCRLFQVIQNQEPCVQECTQKLYWRCGMTRAMLQTFVRSLTHGQLSLSKNVGIAEALTTFEYENVPVGVPADRRSEVKFLRGPAPGAVFQKRAERVHEIVRCVAEQIAHAIATWPRLEACLESSIHGLPVPVTCTSSRVWLRFARKPRAVEVEASVLANNWPLWVQCGLHALGILHSRLAASGKFDEDARDDVSFAVLQTRVCSDALGPFYCEAHDWPRATMNNAIRREHALAHKFALSVRKAITDSVLVADATATARRKFAFDCITLVKRVLVEAPSPEALFSGRCADDTGKTSERTQLQRSLLSRGIKLCTWCDEKGAPDRPLLFPPSWSEQASGFGSAFLLDFSEVR